MRRSCGKCPPCKADRCHDVNTCQPCRARDIENRDPKKKCKAWYKRCAGWVSDLPSQCHSVLSSDEQPGVTETIRYNPNDPDTVGAQQKPSEVQMGKKVRKQTKQQIKNHTLDKKVGMQQKRKQLRNEQRMAESTYAILIEESVDRKGNKFFYCTKCKTTMKHKLVAMRHSLLCKIGKNKKKVRGKSKRMHKCNLCSYENSKVTEMTRHRKIKHTDIHPRKYSCTICLCQLSSTYSLRRHVLVHRAEHPHFTCKTCQKVFSSKWNMNRHTQVHKHVTQARNQKNDESTIGKEQQIERISSINSYMTLRYNNVKQHQLDWVQYAYDNGFDPNPNLFDKMILREKEMQMVEAGQRSNTSINMSCRSDTLNMENETLDETVSMDYETQMEEVESVFGTGDHTNKLPELQEPQTLSQLQEESMGCSVTLSRLLQLATPISPSILMNLPPSYKVFVVGPESLELPNVVGSVTNTGVPKFACHHCPYKAQDSRDRTKHMNSMHQVLEHPQKCSKAWCNKEFNTKYDKKLHLATCVWDCPECHRKGVKESRAYWSHQRVHIKRREMAARADRV